MWAGKKKSDDCSDEEKELLFEQAKIAAELAKEHNVYFCLECHNNTYTETLEGALELIKNVNSDHFGMYWQPNQFKSLEYNLESAAALAKYVTNVHTFNWDKALRFPLSEGIEVWNKYVGIINADKSYEHNYLLEFMPHDTPEEMPEECGALFEIFS